MNLLFIFGDGAVGKMTVGQEVAKLTGMRLFHNHMTIEPVIELFGGTNWLVTRRLRDVIFEEFADSDQYGLIFTYMMAFDRQSEWDYIAHVTEIFKKHDACVCHAELVAPLEVRLERNVSENRLLHKASKRDIVKSNERVIRDSRQYRCVSNEGEIPFENYIKIDNTHIPAHDAAKIIVERFGL